MLIDQEQIAEDISGISTIKDAESFAEHQKIASSFSFKGWGVRAQGSFAMDTKDTFSNDEVRFSAFRKLFYGFKGYEVPPPLSEQAKNILEK